MHFTTLFILKGEKLENISLQEVENLFCERFCYCCGETKPKYQYWCDWFQIGGRWGDFLPSKRGILGDRSWSNESDPRQKDRHAICEIKDLTEPLDRDYIYSVATKSKIYLKNSEWHYGNVDKEKFNKLLDDIDNKKFDGVIALIDCHD